MKTIRNEAILLLFLFTTGAHAQTSIDTLTETLDKLSSVSLDSWKMSTSFSSLERDVRTYSDPDFDDSNWEDLALDQRVLVDSCWLRKEISLPPFVAGHPVKGRVNFLVSVDDYGYLWVNAENLGRFPWDGEFVLTEGGKPDMRFVLLIKAMNTGGPLRMLRARVNLEDAVVDQQRIEDFSLSLQTGQKLTGFDTYQTNARVRTDPGTDKSGFSKEEKLELNALLMSQAEIVNVDALRRGDLTRFWNSVNEVRRNLQPVSDFVKRFTLYFDSNAHIDAAWLWREKETQEVCKRTFSSVMNMMKTRPDFTYTQSQAALYRWMEELYPDLFKQIQDRVEEGRWEIVGGMWVEPDCNLPDGVSWARQLLYGQRYFEDRFGKRVRVGWNPDSFGYNWNMPQFFLNSGIDVFITQKIGWNDTNVFPHRVFWWQAPDGSRILAYFPFNYVDTIEKPFRLADWLRQFEANTGFTRLLILFGVGDHGGGPSLEMMDRIDRLKSLDIFPRVVFGDAETYLDWLRSMDLSELPVWNDELYLESHRGTFTTQAGTKKWNRACETILTSAEKFSCIANLLGREYNSADLEEAWRRILFNQFHDILPGSSVREVYFDSEESYQEASQIGEHELTGALSSIAENINTSGCSDGIPLVVFNPLSWKRSDVTAVQLPEGDSGPHAVFDLEGREVPSQVVVTGKYSRELIFRASDVPSLGYRVYALRGVTPSRFDSDLAVSESSLENRFFRVKVDPDSGWVRSIVDRRSGREIISSYGNRLQLFDDKPDAWDAWNIGLGEEYGSTFRRIEVVERGPVRVVLRIHRDFLKPGVEKYFPTEDYPTSFFHQDVILFTGNDRIDFKTHVEWWEENVMLKVAFPLTVSDTVATYEIPYGSIERSTTLGRQEDRGKWEVPALRWADLSSRAYGVSLLNNSKYGYDIKGSMMRLSMLRSPKWPDPTADRGNHTIEYALYPHEGDWKENQTVRRGYEFNTPLLTVLTDRHKGSLPPVHSFVELSPSNLILTSVKRAEDDPGAWVFQWYDSAGEETTAVLTLPREPAKVYTSNFLEENGEELNVNNREVEMPMHRSGISTVKVVY